MKTNRYLATFPAGTYEIISKHLKSFSIDELKIFEYDDSSVIFESTLHFEKLIELRYLTNIYLIIERLGDFPKRMLNGPYFRLMMLKEGTPYPIEASERLEIEEKIKKELKLKPNTHLSRNDFYLIERFSGTRIFAFRLPRSKFKREKLQAGELRPELAHILCLAAGLKAKHVILDMFAGYGSIPFEAARGFGCRQILAVDRQLLSGRREHPSIKWYQADSIDLDFIADNSIDRIITDPPWGSYDEKIGDLLSLHRGFIREMIRILKPDGIAVVLSGYDETEQIIKEFNELKIIGRWNILVSGKKATIFKLQKARK